ncbi:MAG: hypothetical protein RIS44_1793 [Pseudomonadota bacterium]|jgi:hypothetical protein
MIFLVDYDRATGSLIEMTLYTDLLRGEAERARLTLEMKHLESGVSREVVLLEAASEQDLRRSHRRYFEGLEQLTRPPIPLVLNAA